MGKVIGEKNAANLGGDQLSKKEKYFITEGNLTRIYYVLGSSLSEREPSILNSPGIPALGSVLLGTVCKTRNAKEVTRVNDPKTNTPTILWEVTVTFDTDVDFEDEDPEDMTPKIRWYGETEDEVLERDAITGEPIITKPGDILLITHPLVLPVLEVKRFEVYPFDPTIILQYANKVNADTFYGAPPGTALMMPMSTEEQVIKEVKYNLVTYTIKFKLKENPDAPGTLLTDSWKSRPLHHGVRYFPLDPPGSPPRVFTDANGNPATVNLDDNGHILPDGFDPVYLEFHRFAKVAFNTLGLGPF